MSSFKKEIDKLQKQNKKIESFGDLLEALDSIEDKKKFLWKQIYDNAVSDRELALGMLEDAKTNLGTSGGHTVVGPVLAKYIERMSRANDQLIKLAEMLKEEMDKEAEINPEHIYDQITKQVRN